MEPHAAWRFLGSQLEKGFLNPYQVSRSYCSPSIINVINVKKHKQQIIYSILLLVPDVSSNGSFFGMYFTSNVVHNTRQLVLYDLSTIVAAVGGSMGMFLGFSCLQFFRQCLDWIMDSFPNSKN